VPGNAAPPVGWGSRSLGDYDSIPRGFSDDDRRAPHRGDLFHPRPQMTLRSWRPIRKGALIGFAAISLPVGLEIDDVPVLVSGGKAWATLPARPIITADGRVAKLPGTGKPQFITFLRWRDRQLSAAFSQRVVALVREHHPEAFVEEGGAQ
jgi:hypothetical protein